jgi:hypothetical protein
MSTIAAFVLPGVNSQLAAMEAVVAALHHFEIAFAAPAGGLDVRHGIESGEGKREG